jgi:hypothetical protein
MKMSEGDISDITGELLSNCVLQFCWRKDEYKTQPIICQLSICMGRTSEIVIDEYPMIQSFSTFGSILCWQFLHDGYYTREMAHVLFGPYNIIHPRVPCTSVLFMKQRGLAIYTKTIILRQKKNYENSNI